MVIFSVNGQVLAKMTVVRLTFITWRSRRISLRYVRPRCGASPASSSVSTEKPMGGVPGRRRPRGKYASAPPGRRPPAGQAGRSPTGRPGKDRASPAQRAVERQPARSAPRLVGTMWVHLVDDDMFDACAVYVFGPVCLA